jgi:hypothetical protein
VGGGGGSNKGILEMGFKLWRFEMTSGMYGLSGHDQNVRSHYDRERFRDGNVASTLESKKYATRNSSVSRRPRKDMIFSCISVVHFSVWLTIR